MPLYGKSSSPCCLAAVVIKRGRTRIKICGFTRAEDVQAAVAAGVDAIGLVRYAGSPRYVSQAQALQLAALLPPFVTPVLLYVHAEQADIAADLQQLPQALVQLHGDETPEFCRSLSRPYIKAARIPTEPEQTLDLMAFCQDYADAQAILLDVKVAAYGGSGQAFDWQRIPPTLPQHVVVSAGLQVATVAAAVTHFASVGHSLAVDVSSGVELAPGIKDTQKMHDFCAAVRQADAAAWP